MKQALILLAAVGHAAHADAFEGVARARLDDLVWAVTASCEQGDDTQQRQCKQVRDRKGKLLAGQSIAVTGGGFEVGTWDAAKKSVPLKLAACLDCNGFELDGRTWFVVGTGASRVDGGKLHGPTLHDSAKVFADQAAAGAWLKPLANVRVDYVVKVPLRTQVGKKDVIQLEVTAWRVVNPCDGSIVVASAATTAVAPDPQACK